MRSSPLLSTMTQTLAHDGELANLVILSNVLGSQVVCMDIGATWLSCQLAMTKGECREVLLGVSTLEDFYAQEAYLGASIGRYANRIAQGKVTVDERDYQLSVNQASNLLHGGVSGFDRRRWNIAVQTDSSVTFTLLSMDGDQGFPGNLAASVTYTLTDENSVMIVYEAQCDQTTPINLTNHAYFNLEGANSGSNILEHSLQVNADYYLPTTEMGIPLGKFAQVENSGFNFRRSKKIMRDFLVDKQQKQVKGYDHAFILKPPYELEKPIAHLSSPDGQISLSVSTNKPALQVYTGNFLAGVPNREGGEYRSYAGIALESQFLPDSPNHPEWEQPTPFYSQQDHYSFTTIYQFTLL